MESKYDRVAYPENVYLHSDGEVEDFGTGVYPVSVISHKNFHDNNTFKIACFKVRRKFKNLLIASLIFVLVVILVIPILVASSHKTKVQKKKPATCETYEAGSDPNDKEFGLFFQPQLKGSSLICYDKEDTASWKKYVYKMDHLLYEYVHAQQTSTNGYVDCSNSTPPAGKDCSFNVHVFSNGTCTHATNYGYETWNPCVMLKLKLPASESVTTFDKSDFMTENYLHYSKGHIGVSCEGLTEEDKKHFGRERIDIGPDKRVEDPVDVSPLEGFPVYYYGNAGQKMVPAVMVQFNTIAPSDKPVNIKCTAWAKSFNNGQPQNSMKYTTIFRLWMQ